MAQTLESRIVAALRSAARLKDVESVIADTQAAISATQVKLDQENARSVDPALTTPEAGEARNNAADLEHDIRRLKASLGMLEEKRTAIVNADTEAERRARYDAAKAERDSLAGHIRTRYPELAMELVAMARRIEASEAECEAASRDRPRGAAVLETAEAMARDCGGAYWSMAKGGGNVPRIADVKMPLLGRDGTYLPMRANVGDLGASTSVWERRVALDLEFSRQPVPGIEPAPSADLAEVA